MTRTSEIEVLKQKASAIQDRLRSLEERIREIEQSFYASAIVAFVAQDGCVGCGTCQDVCPAGAISVSGIAQVDPKRCTGCGCCVEHCPSDALVLRFVRKGERVK